MLLTSNTHHFASLLLDYFVRSMGGMYGFSSVASALDSQKANSTFIIIALLAYEYLLTATEEWTLLWKQRKWTGMAWLFLATRLYMLTTIIDTFAPPTEQVCDIVL